MSVEVRTHDKITLPDRIADMQPGYFWARMSSLGDPQNDEELKLLYSMAKTRLEVRHVPGWRSWMSTRRAVC